METTGPTRAAQLRAVADWLEWHPEFDCSQIDYAGAWRGEVAVRNYGVSGSDELRRIARHIGGRWEKKLDGGGDLFKLTQEIAPGVVVELVAWRSEVCERVVTGTRVIEVTEPDPSYVAAAPKITTTKVIEDVEWRCEPLLGREVA